MSLIRLLLGGVGAIFACGLTWAVPVTIDIGCANAPGGTITVDRATNQAGNEGIEGGFSAVTTLADFEKCYMQDHLN